jgi:SpoVK/Ycf46/Vps4 family AAA+-type ATPase
LARAVAGELGARFATVGLHQVLDMWLGNSEKQLHDLFETARRSTPCVLFFDELDAIGHSRMDLGRSAARNVVAQLLVELDGIENSNEGIFVIGATNQPWDVDPALRRPGRFDRTMLILPPDAPARAAILRYHLANRPLADVDFDLLARESEGMSGADLRLACEEAAELGLAEAIASSTVQPITTEQLLVAVKSIRPSTTAWFESARNHVRYANASGEYDELAGYLRQRRGR